MAIEKVGGARAYVIKGNTNPQAKAQYWANLVTQEKYRLWETAQQEALSQMKQEELQYQTQADIYKAQVKGLQDFRRQNERELTKLQLKQAGAAPKVSTTTGTKTIREGGGPSGQSQINLQNKEIKEIRDIEKDLLSIQSQLDLYGDKPKLTASLNQSKNTQKSVLKTKMDAVDNSSMTPRQKETVKNLIREVNKNYSLGMDVGEQVPLPPATEADVATPTTSTTKTVPYTTTRTSGGMSEEEKEALQKRIDELKAEIDATQAEEDKLIAPTLNRTGLLQRTRQVLAEDLQPRQRPIRSLPMSAMRRAELEALGIDQEFVDTTTQDYDVTLPDERPVAVERELTPTEQMATAARDARFQEYQEAQLAPTRQMEVEALGMEPQEFLETSVPSRRETRQLVRETYNQPAEEATQAQPTEMDFEFKPNETSIVVQKEPMREEITYKREVIIDAGKEDALKVLEAEKRPEWVNIVERLYTPTKNQTPQQRAELLKNAWDEITLAYSEDRETMKKAHTLLVAVDKNYNKKQTPK